jgi:dephospho-CoA kinase
MITLFLVTAPLAQRLNNIAKRDGLLPAQIEKIMANQLPETEKVPFADFIIQNDESHSLIEQVLAIHHQLLNQ